MPRPGGSGPASSRVGQICGAGDRGAAAARAEAVSDRRTSKSRRPRAAPRAARARGGCPPDNRARRRQGALLSGRADGHSAATPVRRRTPHRVSRAAPASETRESVISINSNRADSARRRRTRRGRVKGGGSLRQPNPRDTAPARHVRRASPRRAARARQRARAPCSRDLDLDLNSALY